MILPFLSIPAHRRRERWKTGKKSLKFWKKNRSDNTGQRSSVRNLVCLTSLLSTVAQGFQDSPTKRTKRRLYLYRQARIVKVIPEEVIDGMINDRT